MNYMSRIEAKAGGLTRYFTGKPCFHGHVSPRLTCNNLCIECSHNYAKAYRERNPDRVAEKKNKYYSANKDKYREYDKKSKSANREILCERQKARYAADIERSRAMRNASRLLKAEAYRERARKRYAEKRDAILKATAESRRRNAAAVNARQALRRAAKMNATPKWADKKAIRAFYVEARRLTAETGVRHEVDHIVPLLSNVVCGMHTHTNLRVITASANSAKKNKLVDELLLDHPCASW
jgi:hypothetical protein